jgi:O-antigen ligase
MTLDPPISPGSTVREARETARRHARAMPVGFIVLGGSAAGVAIVALFVLLDYRFGQDAHRLVKILLGAGLLAGMVVWPRVGLFALPVLTPFLPWIPKVPIPGVNPVNLLLFSVFSFWAVSRVARGQWFFRRGPLDLLLSGLILMTGLAVLRGAAFPTGYRYDATDAGLQWFRTSMTFMCYFIGYAMTRGPKDRRMLSAAVVVGLAAEAIVTILYGRSGHAGRATGSFGQSNDLGAFLAIFTVFAAALVPGTRRLVGKLLITGAVVAGTVAVLFTVSRGAIAALGVGLLFVAFRSSRVLTFVVLAVLLTSPLWTPDYVKDRILHTQVESGDEDATTLESSSQLRIDTWRAILEVVTSHPLDGVGFAGLGYVLPETGTALGVEVKDSAHNTYLRFLGEMGIFGLAFFLWLLWKCLALARDAARRAASPFDRQLGVGLMGATLTLAACCAFGDRFFPIVITGNFWLLCALASDIVDESKGSAA